MSDATTPVAAEGLRERYAAAAAEWALMYPISSWALADGEKAEGLAKIWGEQIARYLTKYVRDEEVERLRAELAKAHNAHEAKLASLQAFADRCREKDWAHSAEQAKRREEAEAERDALKAARCPSCDHLTEHHQPEGCWYGITTSAPGRDLVCPCILPRTALGAPETFGGKS